MGDRKEADRNERPEGAARGKAWIQSLHLHKIHALGFWIHVPAVAAEHWVRC
jgi:hypothetical protein